GQNKLTKGAGTYTITEPSVAGYDTTYQNCSGVALANGGEQTCTITNTAQQAYVIVKKVVNKTHGGTAGEDDFKLTLDGNATTSGTKIPVNPGNHTAAETQLGGYTFSGFSGDCDSTGKVTVALGETKTCTLTNSDQQAYVIVEKKVNKTHGGTANPDDFKLTLGGNATTSGTKIPVNAGTYTAAETDRKSVE